MLKWIMTYHLGYTMHAVIVDCFKSLLENPKYREITCY